MRSHFTDCRREYLHTSSQLPVQPCAWTCWSGLCETVFNRVYLTTRLLQPQGVRVAPGVKQQRLQAIRDKIAARAELLARPQRFATSQPLSRREMEIEQALFQGKDRLGFLTALYHRGLEFLSGCSVTWWWLIKLPGVQVCLTGNCNQGKTEISLLKRKNKQMEVFLLHRWE